MLSRLSLRVSAPLLVTLPVVVVAIVLVTLAFVQGRSATGTLAVQNLEQIHARIDDRLSILLSTPASSNRIIADLIAERRLDTSDLRSWRPFLWQQTQAFATVSGVTFGGASGHVVWMFRYPGQSQYEFGIGDDRTGGNINEFLVFGEGQITGDVAGSYPYDMTTRPWYRAAVDAGAPTWSEPYAWIHKDGTTVTFGIAYTQPHFDDQGEFVGVIDAELSLEDISNYLGTIEVGLTGQAFILDDQGLLIASSAGTATSNGGRGEITRIAGLAADNPLIARISSEIESRPNAYAGITEPTELALTIDGEPHLAIIAPLEHWTGLSWIVATVIPESDFIGPLQSGRQRSLLIALVVIMLTIVLGALLASWLVRPILALVEHVRRVGAGDLDSEVHIEDTPEFAQLSSELNDMSAALRDRMRLRKSLEMAMEVQQSLLPSETPHIEGIDVAGHSTYCDETGGDYYDFLDITGLPSSGVAVAVGDVMGHGIAAAMLMATARGILRSHCQEQGSLGNLLTHMNELLCEVTKGQRFMTMLLLALNPAEHELRWSSAGHGPPIVFDPESNEFIELDGGELPLGVAKGIEFTEHRFDRARSGQVILASTDGVWEAHSADGEMFGMERLQAIIREHAGEPSERIAEAIRAAVARHQTGCAQEDDITFVIVKVR